MNTLGGAGYQGEAIRVAQHDLYIYSCNVVQPATNEMAVRKFARSCFMDNDILYRQGGIRGKQLWTPACFRQELLAAMHGAPRAGHFGKQSTIYQSAKSYWWSGMSKDVGRYVQSCRECQPRFLPTTHEGASTCDKGSIPRNI